MSNVAALMKGRALEAGDGIYLERADGREPFVEEYLRALVARVPLLKPQLRQLRAFVAKVNALEAEMQPLGAAALADALKTASVAMRRQGFTDELVARAFAAIREASSRTLGLRHHDVQLMGGWVLLHGRIAEMATG